MYACDSVQAMCMHVTISAGYVYACDYQYRLHEYSLPSFCVVFFIGKGGEMIKTLQVKLLILHRHLARFSCAINWNT